MSVHICCLLEAGVFELDDELVLDAEVLACFGGVLLLAYLCTHLQIQEE